MEKEEEEKEERKRKKRKRRTMMTSNQVHASFPELQMPGCHFPPRPCRYYPCPPCPSKETPTRAVCAAGEAVVSWGPFPVPSHLHAESLRTVSSGLREQIDFTLGTKALPAELTGEQGHQQRAIRTFSIFRNFPASASTQHRPSLPTSGGGQSVTVMTHFQCTRLPTVSDGIGTSFL